MIDLDDIAGEPPSEEDLKPYHGRAVVDGEVTYWSASSLELGDPLTDGGCNLKWWFRYVGMQPGKPPTKSQEIGTQLHAEVATYLTTGVRALGALAMTGLHLLPDPAVVAAGLANVNVRIDFGPLRADGLPFAGEIDLENLTRENRGGTDIEDIIDPVGTVEVFDHKTTGERAGKTSYMKTPDELLATVQMSAYGVDRILTRKAPSVRLSHGYYFTQQKRAAEKRTILVPAERLLRRWEGVESLARSLRQVARERDVMKIEPNLNACDAYGGCPYRGTVCTAGARTILSSMFGTSTTKDVDMGILDTLAIDPPADTVGTDTRPPLAAAWDYICGTEYGRPKLVGDALVAVADALRVSPAEVLAGVGKLTAHTCSTEADVIEVADKLRDKAARTTDRAAVMPALVAPAPVTATAPASAAPPPIPPDAGAAQAAPKKRGRPSRQAIPKIEGSTVTVVGTADDRPITVGEVAKIAAEVAAEMDRAVTVFVDCTPSHGATDLRPIVEGWCARAATKIGALDIRATKHDLFGFGAWKGWLAAATREEIKPGRYVLDTRGSEIAETVADALRSVCEATGGEYVRGVR